MNSDKIVSIILDTDMDTDCDDAGALAILNHYHNSGKVKMLGVLCDAPTQWGGSCIETINRYFSNHAVPIGVVRAQDFLDTGSERFKAYYQHVNNLPSNIFYNELLGRKTGKAAVEYPSAVEVYRKILSSSEDSSVTICCIGLLTAIEQLLKSEPDQYSSLNGYELVKAKVCSVTCMSGMEFPKGFEAFNWKMDRIAAEYVTQHCPVPIYVSSAGDNILTGHTFSAKLSVENPVRTAYEKFLGGSGLNRPSWDQIALLYAMKQDMDLFDMETGYTVKYTGSDNLCIWTKQPDGRKDRYIKLKITNEEMAETIEDKMTLRD